MRLINIEVAHLLDGYKIMIYREIFYKLYKLVRFGVYILIKLCNMQISKLFINILLFKPLLGVFGAILDDFF